MPAVGSHRKNIDDTAGLSGLDQVRDQALHDQKWPAHIRVEVPIPYFEAGIEKRAAICRSSRVHQGIDAAKVLDRCVDQPVTIVRDRHIRLTNRQSVPRVCTLLAALFPLSVFRPLMTIPGAPSKASLLAIASPSPCVPPVITAIVN